MLALAPDAARVKGSYGYLPLHTAARFNNNADVIESLMNAYPRVHVPSSRRMIMVTIPWFILAMAIMVMN